MTAMQIGQKIIHLDTVDSTNNYTANLLKSGELKSGTVILADEQFSGRGQRTNTWSTNAGENLTFSALLTNVNMSVDEQYRITQFVAIIIVDFLTSIGITAKIKWPNDILVNQKKIAGILIENQISGDQISSTILGVGLNVNQSQFDGFVATSLKNEKGRQFIIQEVMFGIIEKFNSNWKVLMNAPYKELDFRYLDSLFLLNSLGKYKDETGEFVGKILGVESDGRLKVKKGEEIKFYLMKELEFIL